MRNRGNESLFVQEQEPSRLHSFESRKNESGLHSQDVCPDGAVMLKVKENMALELRSMGFGLTSICRVLHLDASEVAEWFETEKREGDADA